MKQIRVSMHMEFIVQLNPDDALTLSQITSALSAVEDSIAVELESGVTLESVQVNGTVFEMLAPTPTPVSAT